MRITPSISHRNLLDNLENLSERLEKSNLQIATGKKLPHIDDSPSSSAEVVGINTELAALDEFRSNTHTGSFFLGIADDALNSLYNLVTTIFTRGSAVAGDTASAAVRAEAAHEVRLMRDEVLSLANTQARGRYVFSGSRVTAQPFTISGDAVTYNGDGEISKIPAAAGTEVQANVAGTDAFSPAFGAIGTLLAALDANDKDAIAAALQEFDTALADISRTRASVGVSMEALELVRSGHDLRETALKSRRSTVEDADLAQAVSQLAQVQTALRAALTAQTITKQANLFDYLG